MKSVSTLDRGADGFGERPFVADEPAAAQASLLSILRRRWLLVLGATALCVGGMAGRLYVTTPTYRSEARVFVRHGALIVTGDQGNSYTSNLQTQCRVITSTRIVAVAGAHALEKAQRTLTPQNVLPLLTSGLNASVTPGEDLLTLQFEGPDAADAATILQCVIDAYVEFHADRKEQLLAQWRKDSADVRAELDAQNAALDKLRQKAETVVDAGGVAATSADDVSVLREALGAATVEAVTAQSDYQVALEASISGKGGPAAGGASPVADGAAMANLRDQLVGAQDRLRELRTRYLEQHPNVRSAEAQVAAIQGAIAQANRQAADGRLDALRQRATAAGKRRDHLHKQYQALAQAASRQTRDSSEITRREAEASRLQKQLDAVANRFQQYRLDADASSPTVTVVEYPSINLEAVSPHVQRNMLLALAIGLVAGAIGAVTLEKFDQQVRSAADLAAWMRLPVLGAIPRRRLSSARNGGRLQAQLGTVVAADPVSPAAEACRSVRTAIFFSGADTQPRTILITSADPAEGKSTVASNLAIAMARAGRRVLLLDADLRKPVQHDTFEVEPRADLARVLSGQQSLASAIQVADEVENLSLLLCARVPENPSELLNNPAFANLLEELSLRYDHVVIDSPPVSVASDARIIAAFASVSLVVVRAGRTRRSAVRLACEGLTSVGGTVLGLVLNHASHPDDRFGSYAYSYYGSNDPRGGGGDERRPRALPSADPAIAAARLNRADAGDEDLGSMPA